MFHRRFFSALLCAAVLGIGGCVLDDEDAVVDGSECCAVGGVQFPGGDDVEAGPDAGAGPDAAPPSMADAAAPPQEPVVPDAGTDEPGDGSEEPGDGGEKPGDGGEKPGDGGEKPGDGGDEEPTGPGAPDAGPGHEHEDDCDH